MKCFTFFWENWRLKIRTWIFLGESFALGECSEGFQRSFAVSGCLGFSEGGRILSSQERFSTQRNSSQGMFYLFLSFCFSSFSLHISVLPALNFLLFFLSFWIFLFLQSFFLLSFSSVFQSIFKLFSFFLPFCFSSFYLHISFFFLSVGFSFSCSNAITTFFNVHVQEQNYVKCFCSGVEARQRQYLFHMASKYCQGDIFVLFWWYSILNFCSFNMNCTFWNSWYLFIWEFSPFVVTVFYQGNMFFRGYYLFYQISLHCFALGILYRGLPI